MADANDGRVTLWWCGEGGWSERFPGAANGDEYIARPRADDDAREEGLREATAQRDALAQECSETEHVAREAGCDESIRHFPVALHDLLTRLTDERDEATRDRDEWKARAEKAEARCVEMARKIIDRIGAVGPENAEDALDRLFRCDHTNAITLKRTDEARCAALARATKAEADRDRARAELAAQRELWQQIPGGPDHDADENDTSPDDAASHLAGIAIRRIDRIDAETRGEGV